jgi:hypothetical protein
MGSALGRAALIAVPHGESQLRCPPIAMNIWEVEMYESIKPIAAGVGVAALLALGLNAATEASGSTGMYSRGGTAGDTMTMSPDSTTLETASFVPAKKAEVPCGFAQSGGC